MSAESHTAGAGGLDPAVLVALDGQLLDKAARRYLGRLLAEIWSRSVAVDRWAVSLAGSGSVVVELGPYQIAASSPHRLVALVEGPIGDDRVGSIQLPRPLRRALPHASSVSVPASAIDDLAEMVLAAQCRLLDRFETVAVPPRPPTAPQHSPELAELLRRDWFGTSEPAPVPSDVFAPPGVGAEATRDAVDAVAETSTDIGDEGEVAGAVSSASLPDVPEQHIATPAHESAEQPSEATDFDARWFGPDDVIEIAGRLLVGPLVYAGRHLPAAHDTGGEIEPCLIVPSLPAASMPPSVLAGAAFVDLDDVNRGILLDYLALGDPEPGTPEWALQFQLSGIERRVLLDHRHQQDRSEVPAIISRLVALARVAVSDDLRDAIGAAIVASVTVLDPTAEGDPPAFQARWERTVPGAAATFLGWYQRAGRDIPVSSVMEFVRALGPGTLPVEAVAAPDELRELVELRLAEQGSISLSSCATESGSVAVSATSSSFKLPMRLVAERLTAAATNAVLEDISAITSTAAYDLARYARWVESGAVGRLDEARLLLLPDELGGAPLAAAAELRAHLERACREESIVELERDEVQELWPLAELDQDRPGGYDELIVYLEGVGFGVVPDPRAGDEVTGAHLTVFRSAPLRELTPNRLLALEAVRLAWDVIVSDGVVSPVEVWRLADWLSARAVDDADLRRRALATHLWNTTHHRDAVAERRVRSTAPSTSALGEEVRRQVARFLVALAICDGAISHREVDELRRAISALDLPQESLAATLVELTAGQLELPEFIDLTDDEPAISSSRRRSVPRRDDDTG